MHPDGRFHEHLVDRLAHEIHESALSGEDVSAAEVGRAVVRGDDEDGRDPFDTRDQDHRGFRPDGVARTKLRRHGIDRALILVVDRRLLRDLDEPERRVSIDHPGKDPLSPGVDHRHVGPDLERAAVDAGHDALPARDLLDPPDLVNLPVLHPDRPAIEHLRGDRIDLPPLDDEFGRRSLGSVRGRSQKGADSEDGCGKHRGAKRGRHPGSRAFHHGRPCLREGRRAPPLPARHRIADHAPHQRARGGAAPRATLRSRTCDDPRPHCPAPIRPGSVA